MKAIKALFVASASLLAASSVAMAQTSTPAAPTPAAPKPAASNQAVASTAATSAPASPAAAVPAAEAPTGVAVYFASGSSSLTPQEQAKLDEATRIFNDGKPIVMIITGMADATGAPGPNLLLSQRRADVVFPGSYRARPAAEPLPASGDGRHGRPHRSGTFGSRSGFPQGGDYVALSRLVLVALAAGLLNWAVPAAQASSLGDGDAAFDAGRYGDAAKAWSAAASAGDAEAAFNLGLLYDLGNGVPESAGTAFYWYTRAADGGLGVAAFNVGVMYDSGRGVPVDRTEAGIWYARAAVLGQARAAFNLGQLYEYGEGVPQNYAAARAWYALAGAAIPEAALKASALAARHSTAMAGPLVPPTPVWPTSGGVVALSGPHPGVQLVWTAPAEPQPVTFFCRTPGARKRALQ